MIYVFCQAQNVCYQVPKSILHPWSTLTVSLTVRYVFFLLMTSLRADAEISIFGEICTPNAGVIGWYRAKVLMALKNHWY